MTSVNIVFFMACLFLVGCASNNAFYEWGAYEETLLKVYHEPEYKTEALNKYLQFVENYQGDKPLAPGLYAEAGTFLLEQGDYQEAIGFYKLEYEHWPESRPMLGALIENLEARQ